MFYNNLILYEDHNIAYYQMFTYMMVVDHHIIVEYRVSNEKSGWS